MTARAKMVAVEDGIETSALDLPKRPTKERSGLSPKTKFILAWRRQIARDGGLSQRGGRLAMILDQHLWEHPELEGRYYAEKSQMWLAVEVNVSRTTIQKAFADLVKRGHLEAVILKGQGIENQYLPVLRSEDEVCQPIEDSDSVEESAPLAFEPIFDPAQTAAVAHDLAVETIKADIEALTKDHDREIGHLIDNPGNACLYYMPELFDKFQSAFPAVLRATHKRDSEVDFLELIGLGFSPIALYKDALKHVREARESDKLILDVEDWLAEKLAYARFL